METNKGYTELVNFIKEYFEEHYSWLKDDKGIYAMEVYTDYETVNCVAEIAEKYKYTTLHELEDHLMENSWEDEADVIWNIAEEIIEDLPEDLDRADIHEVVDAIYDNNIAYAYFPLDYILDKIEVDAVMALKSYDSPYIEDSAVLTPQTWDKESMKDYMDELGEGFHKLIRSQGASESQLVSYMESGDTENIFIKDVYNEIVNSDSFNIFAFMVSLPLKEYYKLKEKEIIKVEAGTVAGLIDPFNGGGSVLGIELEKDVTFDRDQMLIFQDGEKGYSAKETYGFRSFNELYC